MTTRVLLDMGKVLGIVILLAGVWWLSSAKATFGAELPINASVPEIEMTIEQARGVQNALGALANCPKMIRDGDKETMATPPCVFSAGVLRAIAKDKFLLDNDPDLRAFDDARTKLVQQYGGSAKLDVMLPDGKTANPTYNAAAATKFQDDIRALLDGKIKVKLVHLKIDDLQNDKQPISSGIVALLVPILDD